MHLPKNDRQKIRHKIIESFILKVAVLNGVFVREDRNIPSL